MSHLLKQDYFNLAVTSTLVSQPHLPIRLMAAQRIVPASSDTTSRSVIYRIQQQGTLAMGSLHIVCLKPWSSFVEGNEQTDWQWGAYILYV